MRQPRILRMLLTASVIIFAILPWQAARGASGFALQSATLSVDAGRAMASMPATGIGLNTAVWDADLQDAAVPDLIHQTGTTILRYPGGSTSDVYHWQTNSITPNQGGYANPNNTFDRFMTNTAQKAGDQVMITVNYGSNSGDTAGGDPGEAAGWVDYANHTKGYGIKYWEIGNEIYGNGYYGAAWETDLHSDHSPTAYANNAMAFAQAMKAQDSSIKIGLVATIPGEWPDGQGPQQWNPTVLSIACSAADFLVVHWYPQSPGSETDAGLLTSTNGIAAKVLQLRAEINQYCGSHASQVGIMVTETNSVSSAPGKQTTSPINGLFLIQDYASWLENGVQNVTWWDLHNGGETGNNNSRSLAGSTNFGSYGILSSGTSPEPPVNTAYPAYTALQLLGSALLPGAAFVHAAGSSSSVNAYALTQADGRLAIILVNDSPTDTVNLAPTITGFPAPSSIQATTFSLANPQLTTSSVPVQSGSFTYSLSPYTATVLELNPSGTPTPRPTGGLIPAVAARVLGNFEGSTDGFSGNANVTNMGESTWSPTISLGSSSLWVQYSISAPWDEVQVYKDVNLDLRPYHQISAALYPKSPTVGGPGVKARFLVWGSDGSWYSSPYQEIPLNTLTTMRWNLSGVPRDPLKQVYVCWQYTTADTGAGNEMWVDAVVVSSDPP